jgi:hypothetical protein
MGEGNKFMTLSPKEYERKPHVAILGAGASCAAIPNGDKNGRKISAMNGFIDTIGLSALLDGITLQTQSTNLEDIYMELDVRSQNDHDCLFAKKRIEEKIFELFFLYELPDYPTSYDFLILSLTQKDLIATFNWDPLLLQSYHRCSRITRNLPELSFLHGNVDIGYCEKDDSLGRRNGVCRCGNRLTPVDLLYPVKNKDYHSNPFIKKEWDRLSDYLRDAYMFTIFGYSAPSSDVSAMELLKSAWGKVTDRNMEQIEIVDIREEDEVKKSWKEFIHTHHCECYKDFFETTLGRYPRRSCEATVDRYMRLKSLELVGFEQESLELTGFKQNMTFKEIEEKIKPLLDDEVVNANGIR